MFFALVFAFVAKTNALVWHKADETTVHCEDVTVADQASAWCKNNCWRYETWNRGECPSRFNYVNSIEHPAEGIQIREVGVFAQVLYSDYGTRLE